MSESIANIISGKPYKLLLGNNNYLCSDITYRKLRSVIPLIQSFQPVDHDNQVSFYRRYSAFHVNGSKHNTRVKNNVPQVLEGANWTSVAIMMNYKRGDER
jgi:hypothetical protein